MQGSLNISKKIENPLFVADVEDNQDPTFSYRIKVRIPGLHGDSISKDDLPWALRVDTAFMGTSEEGDLSHSVPEVGSKVLVLALGDDPNSLVYIGMLYKKSPQTPAGDDYGGTYGVYRKDGQFIGVDKIKKFFQLIFDGNLNIDKIHQATIKVSDKTEVTCPLTTILGDLEITGNIKVTGDVSITGNVSIKGDTNMDGKLTVSGQITGGKVTTAAGKDLDSHVHGGVMGGGGTTTPPV